MLWKLKRLWERLTEDYVYVGRVVGRCHFVKDGQEVSGGQTEVVWNLYEKPSGQRCYEKIGYQHGSAEQVSVEAQVRAWVKGGPQPDRIECGPKPRPDSKVVTIDGERVG